MIPVSFSLFLYFFLLLLLFYVIIYFYKKFIIIIIILFIYFFLKIILFFHVPGCSGMFRNVPACSGMFHVPVLSTALQQICFTKNRLAADYFIVCKVCFQSVADAMPSSSAKMFSCRR